MIKVNISEKKKVMVRDIKPGECFFLLTFEEGHYFIKCDTIHINEKARCALSLKDWRHWQMNLSDYAEIVDCEICVN